MTNIFLADFEEMTEILEKIVDISSWAVHLLIFLPIVVGLLVGMMKGFRKSATRFFFRLFILLVFILTLNPIAKLLYGSSLFGQAGKIGARLMNGASSTDFTTLKDVLRGYVMSLVTVSNEGMAESLNNPYFLSLIDSIGVFALKIAWGLIFFTVIFFILWIIKCIVYSSVIKIKDRKERRAKKSPLVGGMFGILNGLMMTIIYMTFLGGLLNVVSYTKKIEDIKKEAISENENNSENASLKETINVYLDDEDETKEITIDVSSFMETYNSVKEVTGTIDTVAEFYNKNPLIKGLNALKIKDKTGRKRGLLDANFDALVYMEYRVESENEDEEDLLVRVDVLEEVGDLYGALMYLITADGLIDSEGKMHLNKLTRESVESVFNAVSEIDLIRVSLAVGLSVGVDAFKDKIEGVEISNDDINKISRTDILGDVKNLGKVVGTLMDMGLIETLSKFMNSETKDPLLFLEIFDSTKEGATALRDELINEIKGFDLLKTASDVIAPIIIDYTTKSIVDEYSLDDVDLNSIENDSYIDAIKRSIDLNGDISEIVKIIFDVAKFNGSTNNISYLKDNYKNLTKLFEEEENEEGELIPFTKDDLSELMNSLLSRLSSLSFINAGMDVGVKILVETLETNEENNYKEYLTEENIFASHIKWDEELGSKIPNLVDTIIDSNVISMVLNVSEIKDSLWEKSKTSETDSGLTGLLEPTINALFSLTLLSNLEDTCLIPLLESYTSKLSETVQITFRDDFGTSGHKVKDELLLVLGIVDDLILGAKEEGAASFEDIFNTENISILLGAIASLDPAKLENSTILSATMVNYLSTFENDTIKVPYIYEDSAWWSTETEKGELYKLVEAIEEVAKTDSIKDIISSGAQDSSSMMNSIKNIDLDAVDKIFSSATIRYTITNLLDGFESTGSESGFSIKILNAAKSDIKVSNYKVDEEGNPIDSNLVQIDEEIKDKDGNTITKLATISALKPVEFKAIIKALWQIGDIDDLLSSNNIVETIKSLGGYELDSKGERALDDNNNPSEKKRYEVLLESNVLYPTLSHFLTGDKFDTFNNTFKFPVTSIDSNLLQSDGMYYINRKKLNKLFDSLFLILDKTELDNFENINVENFKNLGNLSDDDLNVLTSSEIVVSTLSELLNSAFGDSSSQSILIPFSVTSDSPKYKYDEELGEIVVNDKYRDITKTEVKSLLKSIGEFDFSKLGSTDDAFDFLKDLLEVPSGSTKSKLDTLLESSIIHTTLSDIVLNMDLGSVNDYIFVPNSAIEDNQIELYSYGKGSEEKELVYRISSTQIYKMIKGLNYIDINAIGESSSNQFDSFKTLTQDSEIPGKTKLDVIFDSEILKCTISNLILNLNLDSIDSLVIPSSTLTTVKAYDKTLKTISTSDTYVLTNTEMTKLVSGLTYLDLSKIGDSTSSSQFDYFKELNAPADSSNPGVSKLDKIFESDILESTFSKLVLKMNLSSLKLVVPENEIEDSTKKVLLTINTYDTTNKVISTDNTYIINKSEMKKLVNSLTYLDLDNIGASTANQFDYFKTLNQKTGNGSETKLDIVFESEILQATISDLVLNMNLDSLNLIIPMSVLNDPIKVWETDHVGSEANTYIITRDEIKALIKALTYLDLTSVGNAASSFSSISKLTKETTDGSTLKIDVVMSSEILVATISDVIFKMDLSSLSLIIRDNAVIPEDETPLVYKNTGSGFIANSPLNGAIIRTDEIKSMLNALNYLDIDNFGTGDNVFNSLKALVKPVSLKDRNVLKINKILESDILYSTIANYIATLHVDSIDLKLPKNAFILENSELKEFPNLVNTYNYVAGSQDKACLITKDEITAFVIASSSLDLNKLETNAQGSITTLKNKVRIGSNNLMSIEYINNSLILKASISNYLVDKSSSFGFTELVIPHSAYNGTSTKIIKETINDSTKELSYAEKYSIVIDSEELKALVVALAYIDFSNIGSDTLGAIRGLNETKLQYLLESSIIKYTLSSQIIESAGDNSTTKFYLPKQAFELTNTDAIAFYDTYRNLNQDTGKISKGSQKVLSSTEIKNLIATLSIIDLNNVHEDEILALTDKDLGTLLASSIVVSNISEKFYEALSSNANVNSGINDYMKNNEILYSNTNDYNNLSSEAISRQEILDIFKALNILGVKEMSSFSIDLNTLFMLDDDNKNTNDDYDDNIDKESRVDFLRSIFIRTFLTNDSRIGTYFTSKASNDSNCEKFMTTPETKPYLYIHVLTDTLDNEVYDNTVAHTYPSDSNPNERQIKIDPDNGRITWNPITYGGSNPVHAIMYFVYIDGATQYDVDNDNNPDYQFVSTNDNYSTSAYDYLMYLKDNNAVGKHTIKVVGFVEEGYPLVKMTKPCIYDETTYEVTGTLANLTDVAYNSDEMSISFTNVVNANEYEFIFTDENSNTITQVVKAPYDKRSFKDILEEGHTYSYKITARSNNSSYSSSTYTSTQNIDYTGEIKDFDAEYEDGEVIFTNLDFDKSLSTYNYRVLLNGNTYNLIDLVANVEKEDDYYVLDLSSLSLVPGANTLKVVARKTNYNDSLVDLGNIIYITGITLDTTSIEKNIVFTDASDLSNKLVVIVYDSEDNLLSYNELSINTVDHTYTLDLSTYSANTYRITYYPINSGNQYYSTIEEIASYVIE